MNHERRVPDIQVATPDEIDVIELIGNGHTDAVIARRLGTSVVTIRRRATRLRARVGARTRAEAVAIAVTLGWFKHPVGASESVSARGE